jgi:hypothetical protein
MHQMVEPFIAVLFIAAPWIFGFSEVDSATTVSVAAGLLMLGTGMMTKWHISLMKLIPIRTHMYADLGVGALLIISPFVLGFADEGGATRFILIAGAAELMVALGTRWDKREEVSASRAATSARA